jgi:hypothetical protein
MTLWQGLTYLAAIVRFVECLLRYVSVSSVALELLLNLIDCQNLAKD